LVFFGLVSFVFCYFDMGFFFVVLVCFFGLALVSGFWFHLGLLFRFGFFFFVFFCVFLVCFIRYLCFCSLSFFRV